MLIDEERLGAPVTVLALPTRMENYVARRELATVRHLVRLAPAALLLEKNLGRKSIADTEKALRSYLGVSWEVARAMVGEDPAEGAPATEGAGAWTRLGEALPASAKSRRLDTLDLPGRMRTFVAARGLSTVADLVALSYGDVANAPSVGPGTFAKTLAALRPLETFSEDSLPVGSHWLSLLRDALRALPDKDRLVATQRSGVAGPPPTLTEIGEWLGLTRERIRQLEARALERIRRSAWREPAATRLEALLSGLVHDLKEAGERDPLFAWSEEDTPAFTFFVNEVLAGAVRVVVVDDQPFLTRLEGDGLATRVTAARRIAGGLPFPFESADRARVLANASGATLEEAQAVLPFLNDEWIEDAGLTIGYGARKLDALLAFLRTAPGRVERAEVERRFGRFRFADSVVFVSSGLITVAERIPDWSRWQRRLPPIVRDIIERHGPDRQWTTHELMPLLAEQAKLPPWCNDWTLASILRDATEVRYLGRNVVGLPEAAEDRLHLREAVIGILQAAGGPLDEEDLRTRLSAVRGLAEHTWLILRVRKPVVLFEDDRVGLQPRDVPGGEEAVERATSALFEWLDARQTGARSAELRSFLAALGEPFGAWDLRLLRSVARHDGRFRAAPGGSLGLAEWDSTRAPSQTEILAELLEKHDGVVPIGIVAAALPTSTGEPLARNRIVTLAATIGARVSGDRILSPESGAPATPRLPPLSAKALASVPEATAALFESFLNMQLDTPGIRVELQAWTKRMRAEAAVNPAVETEQVERLAALGGELLERCGRWWRSPEARVWSAAVRYLVCMDDADADVAVGGLDDDEAVLDVAHSIVEPVASSSPSPSR
jgi:hypothetical protein